MTKNGNSKWRCLDVLESGDGHEGDGEGEVMDKSEEKHEADVEKDESAEVEEKKEEKPKPNPKPKPVEETPAKPSKPSLQRKIPSQLGRLTYPNGDTDGKNPFSSVNHTNFAIFRADTPLFHF